jgi:glycosyl transferase, family 25
MASAVERRAEFAETARNARSSWGFVDAATNAPAGLPYAAGSAVRRFGRALTRPEVGAFASHFQAWTALLESSDEQRIVLEDDVLVDWRALDRLAELDFAGLGLDLLRLYATHPFRHRVEIRRFLGPHQHLVQARGMFLGSQGYVLTRRAAARLVALSAPIRMPVDWFLSRYWELGFPNYCLFPFPLIERSVASNIGDRSEQTRLHRVDWVARQYWRVADRLSRELADLSRFRANPFPQFPDAGPSFVERTQGDLAPLRPSEAFGPENAKGARRGRPFTSGFRSSNEHRCFERSSYSLKRWLPVVVTPLPVPRIT